MENISLEGSWILSGVNSCGFLIGAAGASSGIYNVSGDLSFGSIASSGTNIEGFVGSATGTRMEGLTMKGILSSISGSDAVGGLVGSLSSGSSLNYTRNTIRFTEDLGFPAISGGSCAGVCSKVLNSSAIYAMDAMIGDKVGVDDAGGLFSTVENASSYTIGHLVNAMTGSISSTGSSGSSGGIVSEIQGENGVFTVETVANYMSGSVTGTLESGGMAGTVAEETMARSLHELSRGFDVPEVDLCEVRGHGIYTQLYPMIRCQPAWSNG